MDCGNEMKTCTCRLEPWHHKQTPHVCRKMQGLVPDEAVRLVFRKTISIPPPPISALPEQLSPMGHPTPLCRLPSRAPKQA